MPPKASDFRHGGSHDIGEPAVLESQGELFNKLHGLCFAHGLENVKATLGDLERHFIGVPRSSPAAEPPEKPKPAKPHKSKSAKLRQRHTHRPSPNKMLETRRAKQRYMSTHPEISSAEALRIVKEEERLKKERAAKARAAKAWTTRENMVIAEFEAKGQSIPRSQARKIVADRIRTGQKTAA